jgi:leucyl-tRNA synthetase
MGRTPRLFQSAWPVYDPEIIQAEEILVVVQVDGKVRGRVYLPPAATDGAMREAALANERVKGWLRGRSIRKVVTVPQRLVNIVTGEGP